MEVYQNWADTASEMQLSRFIACLQGCPSLGNPGPQTYDSVKNCVKESKTRYELASKQLTNEFLKVEAEIFDATKTKMFWLNH